MRMASGVLAPVSTVSFSSWMISWFIISGCLSLYFKRKSRPSWLRGDISLKKFHVI